MYSFFILSIFSIFLLPKTSAEDDLSPIIDLITQLRPEESFRSFSEYGKKVYHLENWASRPILELDPGVRLTSIAFRVSIRASYAKQGTLLAITNPDMENVFMKMHFSQSLYDLSYMMVDISVGNQNISLNIQSFEERTWLNIILILTEYRIYLYDQTDCLSGDSESISNTEWPSNLSDYSLFLGTTGEVGEGVMRGIELSELLFYSGQQPYSRLCQPTDPIEVTWTNGMSGSGDTDMSGSGDLNFGTTSQTAVFTTASPTKEQSGVSSKGEPGEPGRIGAPGQKGSKGETSVVTQIGLKGENGERGAAGVVGSSGTKGERGDAGVRGEKGEKGEEMEWGKVEEEIHSIIGNATVIPQSVQPTCDSVQSCITVEMMNSVKGEEGMSGDKGDRGETGSKGDIGLEGAKGESGIVGPSGPSGPQGIKGNQGDGGPTGSKGSRGDVGRTGSPGESIVGAKGEGGEAGKRGEAGVHGTDGISGPAGPPGLLGPPGPPGLVELYQGVPGDNGSKGDPGMKGGKGEPGTEGRTGDVGLNGEKGMIGGKGATGVPGPPGIGQQGVRGTKGEPGHMNITDEYLKSAVNRIPELVSLKGEQGDQGEIGVKGESGRQGFPGIPGITGSKGELGTVSSGTMVIHARTRQDMAAVDEPGSLVYRSDLEKLAFLSLDGWLEIRASVTPWVEIVDVGEPTSTSQPDSLCGNGVLDGEEECDSTNFNELTCKLLRGDLYEGELSCTSHCKLDFSLCQLSSIIVFGLTTPLSGRLDGITGADSLCNREIDAGYYKAYIYSFNRNPATLVPYRYHFLPVKNARAETMYGSWAELLQGNMLKDSLANLLSADGEELTNSGYWIGDRRSNCRNWNSQQATDTAFSTLKGPQGYSQSYSTCNQELSLICVLISF